MQRTASPRLSNDTIDFGVPGARITSDRFVGVRYVREGGDPSQSGSASPGARLLGVIQDLPAMTVAAAEKTVASMLSVLPSPKKSKSEAEKTPTDSAQQSRRSSVLQEQEAGAGKEPNGAAAEVSFEKRFPVPATFGSADRWPVKFRFYFAPPFGSPLLVFFIQTLESELWKEQLHELLPVTGGS
jgi:hypothetical protein